MQFQGGYKYPSGRICALLTVGSVLIAALVWWIRCLSLPAGVALLLGIEGTVLLASAYTPIGLTPPSGNFFSQLLWIMKQQNGMPVSFNQPMFFGGLLCLFLSYILNAFVI
jgi:hypothetical protein